MKITRVTVIVPVRNEAANISRCMESLACQSYPRDLLEVIISDDASGDETADLAEKKIAEKQGVVNFRLLISQPGDASGKKAALERAIDAASGELILTTDADCIMLPQWVSSVVNCFRDSGASMITGFVKLQPWHSLIELLQSLEFLSLSGTGAVSVILQKPLLCNGANLAFSKSAFKNAGGYRYGGNVPSGDDTFLMLKLAASGKDKVVFNKDPDAIITSLPITTFGNLVSQRKRWASKVSYYREGYIKRTGIFFFFINLILIAALVAGFLQSWSWSAVAGIWLMKSTADFLFLFPLARYANQQKLLLLFLPAAILYPFYAVTGMLMTLGNKNYRWKERNYNLE